jgi:hypothetical protein
MYPEPQYSIGFKVRNRWGEEEEVVRHVRTADSSLPNGRRIFSDADVQRTPWLYVLRGPRGETPPMGPTAIQDLLSLNYTD